MDFAAERNMQYSNINKCLNGHRNLHRGWKFFYLTKEEYDILKSRTREIAALVKEELAEKNLELYDIKFEFGRIDGSTIALIDEISGGNMRAYMDGKYVHPLDLEKIMLS